MCKSCFALAFLFRTKRDEESVAPDDEEEEWDDWDDVVTAFNAEEEVDYDRVGKRALREIDRDAADGKGQLPALVSLASRTCMASLPCSLSPEAGGTKAKLWNLP